MFKKLVLLSASIMALQAFSAPSEASGGSRLAKYRQNKETQKSPAPRKAPVSQGSRGKSYDQEQDEDLDQNEDEKDWEEEAPMQRKKAPPRRSQTRTPAKKPTPLAQSQRRQAPRPPIEDNEDFEEPRRQTRRSASVRKTSTRSTVAPVRQTSARPPLQRQQSRPLSRQKPMPYDREPEMEDDIDEEMPPPPRPRVTRDRNTQAPQQNTNRGGGFLSGLGGLAQGMGTALSPTASALGQLGVNKLGNKINCMESARTLSPQIFEDPDQFQHYKSLSSQCLSDSHFQHAWNNAKSQYCTSLTTRFNEQTGMQFGSRTQLSGNQASQIYGQLHQQGLNVNCSPTAMNGLLGAYANNLTQEIVKGKAIEVQSFANWMQRAQDVGLDQQQINGAIMSFTQTVAGGGYTSMQPVAVAPQILWALQQAVNPSAPQSVIEGNGWKIVGASPMNPNVMMVTFGSGGGMMMGGMGMSSGASMGTTMTSSSTSTSPVATGESIKASVGQRIFNPVIPTSAEIEALKAANPGLKFNLDGKEFSLQNLSQSVALSNTPSIPAFAKKQSVLLSFIKNGQSGVFSVALHLPSTQAYLAVSGVNIKQP